MGRRTSLIKTAALTLSAVLVVGSLPHAVAAAPLPVPSPTALPLPTTPPTSLPHTRLPALKDLLPSFQPDLASADDLNFGRRTGHVLVGDPIDVVSGAFKLESLDLTVHGRGLNVAFRRTYNSADDWYPSFTGAGWVHSYEWDLRDSCNGTTSNDTRVFRLRRGDGARGILPSDLSYYASGTTATLITRDHTKYTFGAATAIDYQDNGPCYYYYRYLLTSISDPAGDTLTLSYDSPSSGWPKLQTVTDTLGRVFSFSYTSTACPTFLTRVTDPFGRSINFATDATCNLLTATDLAGHVTSYTYNLGTTRHIRTVTDPDGRVRPTNTWDETAGRVTQQVDGVGNITTYGYADPGGPIVTDARGNKTQYALTGCGVAADSKWVNGAWAQIHSYTFTSSCDLATVTDWAGNRTDYSYAHAGFIASRTDPAIGGARAVTSYQYDGNMNLTRVTDPRGFTLDATYDPTTFALLSESQMLVQSPATYATTSYTYGDPANKLLPTQIRSPRGYVTALAYDANANLSREVDPEGTATTYGYDAFLRPHTATDAEGRVTTTDYFADDRVHTITDALLHTVTYAYDGVGNETSLTDRNGNLTAYAYNNNSQLVSITQQADAGTSPYVTTLVRDGNGNVTRTTEASGVNRDAAYDVFDRLISSTEYTSQGTLTTSYTRDNGGNILTRTTPDGVLTRYWYDALSRVTAVSATGLSINYAYDLAGHRISMSDASGTTTYSYDGGGRITQVATSAGNVGYVYDLDGNRTQMTYPGAGAVTYNYDRAGKLLAVTDWASRQTSYGYWPSGLVESVSYPNGMLATHGYDGAGRLTQVTNQVGPTTVSSHSYTLDPQGNRTGLAESVAGVTTGQESITYTYDGLNRLKGSTGAVSETFTYDPADNLLTRTNPSATFTYDGADRLQSDGANPYGWSQADRVVLRGAGSPPPPPQPPTTATFRAAATASVFNGASLTVSRPAGVQSGDMLLAFVYACGAVTLVAPSGWTALNAPPTSGCAPAVAYYHVAASADPSSWSWSFGTHWDHVFEDYIPNLATADGAIAAYYNVNSSTPLSPTTASVSTGTGATITANALTLGSPNQTVVGSYGEWASSTAGQPSSWYERVSYASGGVALRVDDKTYSAAGTSDSVQWFAPTSQGWTAFEVGLVPVPTTPPSPPSCTSDCFIYDALDRMTSATVAGATTNYTYAGDGLIAARGTTTYLWDRAREPAALLQIGTDRIVYGLGPLYSVSSDGSTRALARDGMKSVRAEVSDSGVVLSAFRFAAYGRVLQSFGSSQPRTLGYVSQLSDAAVGLIYMRARWYDPGSGRFMSHDPASSGSAYGYAAGNPLRYTDPTGLFVEVDSSPVAIVTPDDDTGGMCNPSDCAGGDGAGPGGTGGNPTGTTSPTTVVDPAPPTTPATTPDLISNVTVESFGRTVGEGTVHIRPTIDAIESGTAVPRGTYRNDWGRLPAQPEGYYEEFNGPSTPGVRDPGPQRVVTGAGGEIFYSPNHYRSFIRLR